MEWSCHNAAILYKAVIKVGEPKKPLEIFDIVGFWPVQHRVHLSGIHADLVCGDDMKNRAETLSENRVRSVNVIKLSAVD